MTSALCKLWVKRTRSRLWTSVWCAWHCRRGPRSSLCLDVLLPAVAWSVHHFILIELCVVSCVGAALVESVARPCAVAAGKVMLLSPALSYPVLHAVLLLVWAFPPSCCRPTTATSPLHSTHPISVLMHIFHIGHYGAGIGIGCLHQCMRILISDHSQCHTHVYTYTHTHTQKKRRSELSHTIQGAYIEFLIPKGGVGRTSMTRPSNRVAKRSWTLVPMQRQWHGQCCPRTLSTLVRPRIAVRRSRECCRNRRHTRSHPAPMSYCLWPQPALVALRCVVSGSTVAYPLILPLADAAGLLVLGVWTLAMTQRKLVGAVLRDAGSTVLGYCHQRS